MKLIYVLALIFSIHNLFSQNIIWQRSFYGGQIFSSPRCEDLSGDGIKDVVVGAGVELDTSRHGILALNGLNGNTLWTYPVNDNLFTSAVFSDLNGDGKKDVIIGGRLANLLAIDGVTGQLIWEFHHCNDFFGSCIFDSLLNFFTPVEIPDVDNDDVSEFVNTYGGLRQSLAADSVRPNGYLMVISGANGDSIIALPTPDLHETYCSPVIADIDNDGYKEIFFGTGGETIWGSLWMIGLDDLLQKKPNFVQLISSSFKGFIAPVSLADFNADNVLDIVVMCFDGTLYVINGADFSVIAQRNFSGNESASQPCIGYFNNDHIPDIGVVLYDGVFPDYTAFHKYILDGTDLQAVYSKSEGTFSYHSLLAGNTNNDMVDEVLITNHFNDGISAANQFSIYSYDLVNQDSITYFHSGSAYNYACTPAFNDLDDDGFLDLIFSHSEDSLKNFSQFYITRVGTGIGSGRALSWGEYMGTGRNSIFDNRIATGVKEIINPFRLIRLDERRLTLQAADGGGFEKVVISSAEGKLMKKYQEVETGNLVINMNGFPSAVYFISVITARGIYSFKMPVY